MRKTIRMRLMLSYIIITVIVVAFAGGAVGGLVSNSRTLAETGEYDRRIILLKDFRIETINIWQ